MIKSIFFFDIITKQLRHMLLCTSEYSPSPPNKHRFEFFQNILIKIILKLIFYLYLNHINILS